MIFGYTIGSTLIIVIGSVLLAILVLTMLIGLRIIRFKGRRQMKVHRGFAWTMALVASVHAVLALAFVLGWKIL